VAVALVFLTPPLSALWLLVPAILRVERMARGERPTFVYVPLTEIPRSLQQAVIASEDGKFYEHHGVDWEALRQATLVNLRARRLKRGGSTITMQAARYTFLPPGRSVIRKMAEIPLALYVDRRLGKERVLELYFNRAFYGLGARDLRTAARVYFGKDYRTLRVSESAFLAGVFPEPPGTRRTVTPAFAARCQERTLYRLRFFFPTDFSEEQLACALRQPLTFAWQQPSADFAHRPPGYQVLPEMRRSGQYLPEAAPTPP
jgi:membrane peptidoglycan carboxypeptidase